MSDAALRELERAAREGGDAAAWTRLALAQARAGLGGARAAVQALLRDPAAPVRELLVVGEAPAPRALGSALPPVLLSGRVEGWPWVLDLGQGRALLVTGAELVAVDVFTGALAWRRRRDPWSSVAVVGPYVAEVVLGPVSHLVWSLSATGTPAGRLELPDVRDLDHEDLVEEPLVALGDARCAVLLPVREGWRVSFFDLRRGERRGEVELPYADAAPGALLGAEGGAFAFVDGRLTAWDPDGGPRWAVDVEAVEATPLAVEDARLFVRVTRARGTPIELVTFDAEEGRELHRVAVSGWEVCAGRGLAVTARSSTRVAVEARSLLDGRPAWAVDVPTPGRARYEAGSIDLRLAGDVLLVVEYRVAPTPWQERLRGLPWSATALDLSTGAALWSRSAPDTETALGVAGGLLLAVGPTEGWLRKTTPLRRVAPGS